MRPSVGPARTCPEKRQRNAQQDTKTQRSLAGIFRFRAKEAGKLAGLQMILCWNNHWNELGIRSPLGAEPESTDNLSPCREKVKPETGNLSTFFYIFARALAHLRDSDRGNAAITTGLSRAILSMPTQAADIWFLSHVWKYTETYFVKVENSFTAISSFHKPKKHFPLQVEN